MTAGLSACPAGRICWKNGANWPPEHHNPEKFWRALAAENGIYVLACNRTGKDKTMDCRSAESFIIDTGGGALKQISSPDDIIIYGTLPLESRKLILPEAEDILGRRRPHYYGNISLDTFSHFNPETLLNLPEPAEFIVATLQFRPASQDPATNTEKMLNLIDEASAMATAKGMTLNLVILPELSTTGIIFERREAEKWCEESRYSRGIATGSGTDGIIVVANPDSGLRFTDAGKHSKLGELIGLVVKEATKEALEKQTGLNPRQQRNFLVRLERFGVTAEDFWQQALREGTSLTRDAYLERLNHLAVKDDLVVTAAGLLHLLDEQEWGLLPADAVVEVGIRLVQTQDPRPAVISCSVGGQDADPAGRLISLFIGLVNRNIR